MIIGVDAASLSTINDSEKTGNFWLAHNFLRALSAIDKKNIYRLYSFAKIPEEIIKQYSDNFENYIVGPKRFWMQARMSIELLLNQSDVFLGFNQSLPLIANGKNLLFVLDLAFEKFPKNYPKIYQKLSWQTKSAIAKATRIVAISKATKNDLTDLYHVPKEKINVIYPFCENIFQPLPNREVKKYLAQKKITKPYFLYLGANKKSKNIELIKKAYSLLSTKEQKKAQLIFTYEKFGFVTREELPYLYNGALALVSPSVYEGFGLPHLEAISCGIPVICTARGSQKEVVGDAGLYVQTDKPQSLTTAMQVVLTDTKRYNFLREAALLQKIKFNSHLSAQMLLMLINSL